MEALPLIAITSAFERTKAEILIGYLNESDLPALPVNIRVQLIKLENTKELGLDNSSGSYSDFSEDDFYRIVQLKWQLLQRVLELDFDFVIYSDTDIYWNIDPIDELSSVFNLRAEVSVQIQSFTDLLSHPKLCMGFVAFRNSEVTNEFLAECKQRHLSHSMSSGRIGDDDIVTQYYLENNFPQFIQELPQTTFPVGRMLNLYNVKSKYPGLPSPEPFIFHANYVVGLRNKIILMKIFIRYHSKYDQSLPLGVNHFAALQVQRLRFWFHQIRINLFK